MTNTMNFNELLASKLRVLASAHFALRRAQADYEHATVKANGFMTQYAGEELNRIVSSSVKSYCDNAKNALDKKLSVNVDTTEAAVVLIGKKGAAFNAYDEGIKNEEQLDSVISAFLLSCNFDDFEAYVKIETAKLGNIELTHAADNIISLMGLGDTQLTSVKPPRFMSNHVVVHMRNSANWSLHDYSWNNSQLKKDLIAASRDISTACNEMHLPNISSSLQGLHAAVNKLGVFEKLPSGMKFSGCVGSETKIYKEHLAMRISKDDFSGLMAFLTIHKSMNTPLLKGDELV